MPNLPHDSVPEGKGAEDNLIERSGGSLPELPENALPHWELAKKYDIIDFELGVKITGAGFPVYKGKGARLQRALINFFLDCAREAGFLEVQPPYMVNSDSGFGTGQLPDKEGQMYYVGLDDLYLIPTAEVPVTNIYRDVILDEKELPIKMQPIRPVSVVRQVPTEKTFADSTGCISLIKLRSFASRSRKFLMNDWKKWFDMYRHWWKSWSYPGAFFVFAVAI